MALYVGIDPGFSGALALIANEAVEGLPLVTDVPTLLAGRGKRRKFDVAAMCAGLRGLVEGYGTPAMALIELQVAMPRQSVVTGLQLGRAQALWESALVMLGVPYDVVTPSVWKREMGLIGLGKDASLARAKTLFPTLAGSLLRKKDDGRADALLIAEVARRRYRRE